jgi:diaminopimelate decarboxylase
VIDLLVREHGSPLWLVDLDRVRGALRDFRAAWQSEWPDVEVAYSYKTNRTPAILRAVAAEGAVPEVVCWAEYELARRFGGAEPIVNGPVKPDRLLRAAADDDALVIADSADELERIAAAGVRRVGLRVAVPGVGVGATRFGIEAGEVPAAARAARSLGLNLEVLHAHVVATGFREPPAGAPSLGAAIFVEWPPEPTRHVDAAKLLANLAVDCDVHTIDLGGGHPHIWGRCSLMHPPAHERAPSPFMHAVRASGFAGRIILEPGRAIVAGAVDLALTVAAVKRLADGTRCVIVDGGTNLLPGALWGWPSIEPVATTGGPLEPTLVTGPLCLNVDVLHPAAELPPLRPGDLLVARGVGAYQQAQSTQFGDLRPAAVAREDGRWRLVQRSESIEDVIAGDLAATPLAAGASIEEETP